MPQVLKESVRESLVAAAAEVFAKRGYERAAVGEIAAAAGLSTGNVYRYFPGKRELFDAVVPPTFVRRFRELLRRRVRALNGIRDVHDLPPEAPYHLASEELLRFCIDHRLGVIVLLARSGGSRYARFAEHTVDDLVRLAVAHFESVDPARAREVELRRTTRFDLTEIYRAFVQVLVAILVRFESEASIREAVAAYTRYHLAGLKSFFEGE
jgi:AcrR family transcriptional regulator